MRKAHPAFHMGDAELVRQNVHFLPAQEGVVAYMLNGEAVGDSWKTIVVILNSQLSTVNCQLPEGKFRFACVDGECPYNGERTAEKTVRVAPQSAAILYL
jgi:pullulanase